MREMLIPQSNIAQFKILVARYNSFLKKNGFKSLSYSFADEVLREWYVTERNYSEQKYSWQSEGKKKIVKLQKILFQPDESVSLPKIEPDGIATLVGADFDMLLNEPSFVPIISFSDVSFTLDQVKRVVTSERFIECDHCNLSRNRMKGFLVIAESGHLTSFGCGCFYEGSDASLMKYVKWKAYIASEEVRFFNDVKRLTRIIEKPDYKPTLVSLDQFVANVLYFIQRDFGFRPKSSIFGATGINAYKSLIDGDVHPLGELGKQALSFIKSSSPGKFNDKFLKNTLISAKQAQRSGVDDKKCFAIAALVSYWLSSIELKLTFIQGQKYSSVLRVVSISREPSGTSAILVDRANNVFHASGAERYSEDLVYPLSFKYDSANHRSGIQIHHISDLNEINL